MTRIFSLLLLCVANTCCSQIITTIAGTGTQGRSGDGGSATAANLFYPTGVAVDSSGNIYFGDSGGDHRIRKISTSGIITTVAGTGTAGYSGDGGNATAAKLYSPMGVAIDRLGNLYIADNGNGVIRKVSASGIISTFAGVPYGPFCGCGVYVGGFSGDGGYAIAATFYSPVAVAVDCFRNVYVADQVNNSIRMIDTSGIIHTIAGHGSTYGSFTGDGGAATSADLKHPAGVNVDREGNVLIADTENNRIRKVSATGIITTIVGDGSRGFGGDGGQATAASISWPDNISSDGYGNIYIEDYINGRIRKVNSSGTISTYAGSASHGYSGDGGAATNALISAYCGGLAADLNGNLYFSDRGNYRIRKIVSYFNNHAPNFLSNRYTVGFCSGNYVLNSQLRATDIDAGQVLTWSLYSSPLHGTASVDYSTTSTGSIITPSGLTYTSAIGYTGLDSFVVKVSDGVASNYLKIVTTIYSRAETATISGPGSVCEGATITLTPSISGGAWSTENSLATVSSSGVVTGVRGPYTNIVYYTTSSARCGTVKASHGITINKVPVVYPITGASTVAVGGYVSLTDYTPGGSWSTSNSSASVDATGTVTGVSTGTVNIIYSVSNACGTGSNSKSITVTGHRIDASTGSGFEVAGNAKIYPNPSNGFFTLELPEGTETAAISIFDISGKIVSEVITKNPKEDFDVSNWAKGIYLIQINTDHINATTKIVLE